MNNRKGQILLVVFMLLLFVSIMVGGAAFLWQSGVNTAALQKDSLRAFYIAQAGIEKGRAEIAVHVNDYYNETFTNKPFGGGAFDLNIVFVDEGTKDIVSRGRFANSTREIKMRVVATGGSGPGGGAPYGNAWGWHSKNDDTWIDQ